MGINSSQPVPTQASNLATQPATPFTRPISSGSEIAVDPSIQGTKKASRAGTKRKRGVDKQPPEYRSRDVQKQSNGASSADEHVEEPRPAKKARTAKMVPRPAPQPLDTNTTRVLTRVSIPKSSSATADSTSPTLLKKRKQATGRPSAHSFAPMLEEDGRLQAVAGTTDSASPSVAVEVGRQVTAETQKKKKKTKTKREQKLGTGIADSTVPERHNQEITPRTAREKSLPVLSFTAINSPNSEKHMRSLDVLPFPRVDMMGHGAEAEAEARQHKKKRDKRKHGNDEDSVAQPTTMAEPQEVAEVLEAQRDTHSADGPTNLGLANDVERKSKSKKKRKKEKKKKEKKERKRRHSGDGDGHTEHFSDDEHQTSAKRVKKKHVAPESNAVSPEVKREEQEAFLPTPVSRTKKRKRSHAKKVQTNQQGVQNAQPMEAEGAAGAMYTSSLPPEPMQSVVSREDQSLADGTSSGRKHKAKRKSRVTDRQQEDGGSIEIPVAGEEDGLHVQQGSTKPWVQNWLNNGRQSTTKVPQASPAHVAQKPSKRPRLESEDDASEYQPPKDDSQAASRHASPTPERTSVASQNRVQYGVALRKTQYDGIDKGPFSANEKAIADEVFLDVCEQEDITTHELKFQIQHWVTCGVFKNALIDALPRRSSAALRKFAKNRYTPMERGPWTGEQDERLRAAHVQNPGRWTIISESVERPAPDCKDRWINHLKYDDKEVGAWSQKEEAALAKAVRKCVKKIRKANKNDTALRNDPARLESMVNWETVALKLGGKRPARRCRIKWEKLKSRKTHAGDVDHSTKILEDEDFARSENLKRAQRRYVEARIGNKFEMLMEVADAVDAKKSFNSETTLWSSIALANMNSPYDSSLRRCNYYACLLLSESVLPQGTIADTALLLAQELAEEHGDEALNDKTDPAVLRPKPPQQREKSSANALVENADAGNRPRSSHRRSRPSMLSAEYVHDSSDEERGASRKENVAAPAKETLAAQQRRRMQTPTPAGLQEFTTPVTASSINSTFNRGRQRKAAVLGNEEFQAMVAKRLGTRT